MVEAEGLGALAAAISCGSRTTSGFLARATSTEVPGGVWVQAAAAEVKTSNSSRNWHRFLGIALRLRVAACLPQGLTNYVTRLEGSPCTGCLLHQLKPLTKVLQVNPPTRTLAKPFTIAGFILGEIYMLYTVLAPNLQGMEVPIGATIKRILAFAIFFGPFGAAAGLGVGLLVSGAISLFRKTPPATAKPDIQAQP